VNTKRRIHWPNALTLLRALLVIPVVLLTLKRTEASDWVAFVAFGVAALTDGLDGAIARRLELVSPAGQFLDPLADKVLVIVSMVALIHVGRFEMWAAVVIVVREIIVTTLRIAASRRGRGFPASVAGKMKTGVQLIAVLLSIVLGKGNPVRLTFLWLAVVLTVVSGVDYVRRAPKLLGAKPG
jgi:CDP-diacylglycerol---glycerol-3-phosphate 3-phosphatidyltransferase